MTAWCMTETGLIARTWSQDHPAVGPLHAFAVSTVIAGAATCALPFLKGMLALSCCEAPSNSYPPPHPLPFLWRSPDIQG